LTRRGQAVLLRNRQKSPRRRSSVAKPAEYRVRGYGGLKTAYSAIGGRLKTGASVANHAAIPFMCSQHIARFVAIAALEGRGDRNLRLAGGLSFGEKARVKRAGRNVEGPVFADDDFGSRIAGHGVRRIR